MHIYTHTYCHSQKELESLKLHSVCVCLCVCVRARVSEVLTLVSLAVTLIAVHLATSRQSDPFISLQPPRALALSLQSVCVHVHVCVYLSVCVSVCLGPGVKPDLFDLF